MSSVRDPQTPLDPVFLAKVHFLFRICWAEAEKHSTNLDSELQSSLRRSIASQLLREAHLVGILPKENQ